MKKYVWIILLIVIISGVFLLKPVNLIGEGKAAGNSDDIIGTWTKQMGDKERYSIALQFKKDGTLIVYNEFAGQGKKFGDRLRERKYSFNGTELIIDGTSYYCSVEGNGMITNYVDDVQVAIYKRA